MNTKTFIHSLLIPTSLLLSFLLLSACTTKTIPLQSTIVAKPSNLSGDIQVIFITDSPSEAQTKYCKPSKEYPEPGLNCSSTVVFQLKELGFFDIGNLLNKSIIPLLAKRGIKSDFSLLSATEYNEKFTTKNKASSNKSSQLLTIYFSKGAVIDDRDFKKLRTSFTLNVIFSNPNTNSLYGNAQYEILTQKGKTFEIENLIFDTTFDDKYISQLLSIIFGDMEKSGLLPSVI